jgi:hypothetical protein
MSTPPARMQFTGPTAAPTARSSDDAPGRMRPPRSPPRCRCSSPSGSSPCAPEAPSTPSPAARGVCGLVPGYQPRRPNRQDVAADLVGSTSSKPAAHPGRSVRHLAVRRLAARLIATGRLLADPFLGIKWPVQRQPVVMPLSDDKLRALITTSTNLTVLLELGLQAHDRVAGSRIGSAMTGR